MKKFARGKQFVDLVLSTNLRSVSPKNHANDPAYLSGTQTEVPETDLVVNQENVSNKIPVDCISNNNHADDPAYLAYTQIEKPEVNLVADDQENVSNEIPDEFSLSSYLDQKTKDDTPNIIHSDDDTLTHYSDSDNDPNFIVPESEYESSEDENNNATSLAQTNDIENTEAKRTRKRKRNESQWKCRQRKFKRCIGKSYLTAKGNKVIADKAMKPPCLPSCKKKCTENVSEARRKVIFENFYRADFDINMKRLYVANRVKKVDVVRRRSRTGTRENKRSYSLLYSFTVNDLEVSVCKTFFLNTLSVSQSFIDIALAKRIEGGSIISDQRGKHTPANKLCDNVRDTVRKHIESFPIIESHYSRERTQRKYLGNDLCIKRMYLLYVEYCKHLNLPESDMAKEWLYYDIFNKEYNLSFKLPANDTCDTCDEFQVSIQQATSTHQKELIQIDYDTHLIESQKRYKMKSSDKFLSQQDDSKKVIMIDLQKCLATPYLTNSQIFYLRKLWTLNLTIFDASKNITFCTMWDETVAGRGGCEIASCLNKWAKENLMNNNKIEELTIWSDNCAGQNRNYIMISLYFWLLKKCPSLKIINHKFLLKGHTHMEVDVQHSVIERAKKKISNTNSSIMIPWDWQQFIRSCSSSNNPMEVYNMEFEDFLNFRTLFTGNSAPLVIRKKDYKNDNILISEMVHIQVRAMNIGTLFYKTNFNELNFNEANFNRNTRRCNMWPDNVPVCRSTAKKISSAKYKDLQSALKWVPSCFHNFYKNIPHGLGVEEYPEDDSD